MCILSFSGRSFYGHFLNYGHLLLQSKLWRIYLENFAWKIVVNSFSFNFFYFIKNYTNLQKLQKVKLWRGYTLIFMQNFTNRLIPWLNGKQFSYTYSNINNSFTFNFFRSIYLLDELLFIIILFDSSCLNYILYIFENWIEYL